MPRLTTLYTGKGDLGSTRLSSGEEVSKDDLRVVAYGTVDELNSIIGVALAGGLDPLLQTALLTIQNELFHLGSDLSFRGEEERAIPQIEERHVTALESLIDELTGVVGPLQNFILPGGSPGAAQLHVARTVCRRTEREVTSLARVEPVGIYVLPYLNRLSDLLFVMARIENLRKGVAEPLWDSRA
jgi:cob(I)alamin adenosyltransferase